MTFNITQHARDKELLQSIISYLGCGRYCERENGIGNFIVTDFTANYTKICPFFKQHSIVGIKDLNFQDWCLAAKIIQSKKHITQEGLDQILKIKEGMNRGR